jgi:hypothetical protein
MGRASLVAVVLGTIVVGSLYRLEGAAVYESPDAGAGMIVISTSSGESDYREVFACNGYVVSKIGEKYFGP